MTIDDSMSGMQYYSFAKVHILFNISTNIHQSLLKNPYLKNINTFQKFSF